MTTTVLLFLLLLVCVLAGAGGYTNKGNRIGKVLLPIHWVSFLFLLYGLPIVLMLKMS